MEVVSFSDHDTDSSTRKSVATPLRTRMLFECVVLQQQEIIINKNNTANYIGRRGSYAHTNVYVHCTHTIHYSIVHSIVHLHTIGTVAIYLYEISIKLNLSKLDYYLPA